MTAPRRPVRRAAAAGDRAGQPARKAAYDVLRAVSADDAYANLVLPGLLRERGIGAADAALATELGYGALRWQGVLDVVIAACVDRSLDRVDPPVLDLLRLGAYQLLRTRVAPHAAVAETVALARAVQGERVVGFVNAVLRRVSQTDFDGWAQRVAPAYDDDPIGRVAFEHGQPRWIASAMADALLADSAGRPVDPRGELAAALAEDRPRTHLVARPGLIGRDELLAQAGGDAEPGPWSPYAVRMAGGDPVDVAAVRDRRAAVQDEGSQVVALALAAAPLDGADRTWLDACAGPGGKAALLAAIGADRGARVVAADVQPHRAALVARTMGRDRTALVVCADGTRPAWRPGSFDRVLVDAPCTGLGALRRRPEARWRRRPEDVARLAPLQRALLNAALDAARPGAVVAYATCSPHVGETRAVVADVLRRRAGVEQLDARELVGIPDVGPGPHVQLWPHRHGTDAMFLTLLRTGGDPGPGAP